jgi:probable HAF family extracellular repeat protein
MRRNLTISIAAIALLGVLASPTRSAAQQAARYRLIDLGALGGPSSYFYSAFGEVGNLAVNSRGVATGFADTPIPDPNAPNCFGDCHVTHTFQWQNGVLTDLGALPGVNSSGPNDMNSDGEVTGISQNGQIDPITGFPEFVAVVWQNGEITNLGTFGGNFSYGAKVNSRGQVAGQAQNAIPDPFSLFGAGTQTRAFLWQGGVLQDLGTLGGPDAMANFVNEAGRVCGCSYTNSTPNPVTGLPTLDPFLWENGTMLDLGTLGGTLGCAGLVNDQGQVIGGSNLAGDIFTHGFLWARGALTDLGTLGGDNSFANGINDVGEVVGKADLPSSLTHDAFLWKDGVMTDLGTQDGDPCSNALHVSATGQIVGGSSDCHAFLHAFLSDSGGPLIDLNAFVPPGSNLTLTVANSINDRGEISATATLPNGDLHAVLLVPCGPDDTVGCQDATRVNPAPAAQTPRAADQGDQVRQSLRQRLRRRYPLRGGSDDEGQD